MLKLEIPPSEALYPVPVVLVSCTDKNRAKSNIITIAWCGVVCSNPPLLSISIRPSRYSYRLIKESGDFVINIPSKDLIKKTDFCGVRSGADIDKFVSVPFTMALAKKVKAPLIEECPLNIECVLKNIIKLGSHDMFIGEVVQVHADTDILNTDGNINFEKAAPFVYNHGEYWDLGKKIGHYGFSTK